MAEKSRKELAELWLAVMGLVLALVLPVAAAFTDVQRWMGWFFFEGVGCIGGSLWLGITYHETGGRAHKFFSLSALMLALITPMAWFVGSRWFLRIGVGTLCYATLVMVVLIGEQIITRKENA